MLVPIVLIKLYDGVILSPKDSFSYKSIVVNSDRVKLVYKAKIY